MTTPEQINVQVNIVVGLASMLRPDLVARFTPEELRRAAAEVLRKPSVPEPFRAAFEQ